MRIGFDHCVNVEPVDDGLKITAKDVLLDHFFHSPFSLQYLKFNSQFSCVGL